MKFYYIEKSLCHRLNSVPPTLYNAPDRLYWIGCCRTTVKYMKANGKYKSNNVDTVMGWYR